MQILFNEIKRYAKETNHSNFKRGGVKGGGVLHC